MPRVRCPKCDNTTKIADDFDRTHAVCSECGAKIRVAENLLTPAEEKEGGKKKKVRKEQTLDERFAWIPICVVAPLGVLLVLLSLRLEIAAGLSTLIATSALLGGLVWGAVFASRDGAYVKYDWMDSSALRTLLMFFGPYWLGYLVYLQFTQIQYGLRNPKKYLPVMLLEFTGLLMLICCPFCYIARDRYVAQRIIEERKNPRANQGKPQSPSVFKHTGNQALDQAIHDLHSQDAAVRNAASTLLADMKPNKYQAAVAKGLAQDMQGPHTETQVVFYRPMVVWATPKEAGWLVVVLQRGDKSVKIAALKRLAEFKDRDTLEGILDQYDNTEIRPEILATLKAMGPNTEDGLVALLGTVHKDRPSFAASILTEIGSQRVVPAMRRQLQGGSRGLRDEIYAAISAIEKRGK